MIFLGFGKYARVDKIYALEPLAEGERGHGRRTRVWIEGVPDPIIASRTERTILHDMGHDVTTSPIVDQAALHSMLTRIRDLGLPLISIMESDPEPPGGLDDITNIGLNRETNP